MRFIQRVQTVVNRAWPILIGRGQKASRAGHLIAMSVLGNVAWTPRRFDKLADEAYIKNVIAFKAISEIARAAASVPFQVIRRATSGVTVVEGSKLSRLINRPNPMQARVAFFEAVYGFLQIAGNSYIEKVGPDRGLTRELWTKRPDRMTIKIDKTQGIPSGYVFKVGSGEFTFDVDGLHGTSDILHLKVFHPLDDWYGLSPIEAAARSVDQNNELGVWNQKLLQNSARPAGAIMYKPRDSDDNWMGDDTYDRIRNQIEEIYSGPANAGRPMILEGGLEWQEMGLSPKDMDWIEAKNTSARDIAMAFGYPAQMLGIPGDNTFRNMEESRLWLWEQTVIPMIWFITGELNQWLAPQFGPGIELRPNFDEIAALAPRRAIVWARIGTADFLSINEKRAAVGYDAVDGGDDIRLPAAMVPLDFGFGDDDAKGMTDMDVTLGKNGTNEYKLLHDGSREARVREWRIQLRFRIAFERQLASATASALDRTGRRVGKAMTAAGTNEVPDALTAIMQRHRDEMTNILTSHWRSVMEVFGGRLLDSFKTAGMVPETKAVEDIFDSALTRWILANVAKKVVDITTTTETAIRGAINAGTIAGVTLFDLVKLIGKATSGEIGKKRARVIARTETHGASVAASEAAAEATGLELKREWIAAGERTRESHQQANGQVRAPGEKFNVGDAHLLHPGDPSGPAKEVINCRCILGYVDDLDRDL